MVSKIRVLSDHTINKIAAGEVIENPASVVKELVENSLDAGATEICVEIKGGGRQMIRISDNGCGMSPDDAVLCLERHATSKIREVEEIHTLTTMGFRGEAIPSIAAISKLTILTTPTGAEPLTKGTFITVEGGKILHCGEAARSQGTTMEVKSLFFNVPVRKKFQKSPAYDANEILKVLSILALGHPDIAFQLISQGKTVLKTPCSLGDSFEKKLQNRVSSTLGADFLEGLRHAEENQSEMQIQGLFGLPFYARNNRTGQYLFINRRPVFSPMIAFAIKEGYGTSLASGKHPVYVLHLTIPGQLVDVNVHPQKKEVRVRQDQLIKEMIFKAIDQTLQSRGIEYSLKNSKEESVYFEKQTLATVPFNAPWVFEPRLKPIAAMHAAPPRGEKLASIPEIKPTLLPQDRVPPPRVLATIPRYILLEGMSLSDEIRQRLNAATKAGLFVLDQKAAHVRIIFERLQRQSSENETLPLQTLLIPYTFDLSAEEAAILRENIDTFYQLGVQVQEFGQNTFIIDAIPEIFGNTDMQLLITNLLESLKNSGGAQAFKNEKERRLAFAAARASPSQEKRYSIEEAQSVVNQLFTCQNPYQCPQGKLTVLHLAPEELAKQFALLHKYV